MPFVTATSKSRTERNEFAERERVVLVVADDRCVAVGILERRRTDDDDVVDRRADLHDRATVAAPGDEHVAVGDHARMRRGRPRVGLREWRSGNRSGIVGSTARRPSSADASRARPTPRGSRQSVLQGAPRRALRAASEVGAAGTPSSTRDRARPRHRGERSSWVVIGDVVRKDAHEQSAPRDRRSPARSRRSGSSTIGRLSSHASISCCGVRRPCSGAIVALIGLASAHAVPLRAH